MYKTNDAVHIYNAIHNHTYPDALPRKSAVVPGRIVTSGRGATSEREATSGRGMVFFMAFRVVRCRRVGQGRAVSPQG